MSKTGSSKAVILAEYRYLNALIQNKEYWNDSRVSKNLLTSEVAKSVYEAIEKLRSQNVTVTPQSLLQAGLEIDFNVNEGIINSIYDVDENGASSLDDIIDTLEKSSKKELVLNKIDSLRSSLGKGINKEKAINELNSIIDELNSSNDSRIINLSDWSDEYLEELEERRTANRYSYGDELLDKAIYKSCYPGAVTAICANTGAGKSSFVLYLINGLISRNVACLYLSLEMGAIDTYDRLLSMRRGIPGNELYKPDNVDSLKDEVLLEKKEFEDKYRILFSDEPNIDLNKLQTMIREFKQRARVQYGVVVIDLLTMVKEFAPSSSRLSHASSIEISMNKLNAIAKEENVHIIGTAQLGRENEKIRIHSVEELDDMRPRLTDIKNSNAIGERARVVLSLHRPKYFADKYLVPIGAQGADQLDDIIEVQVLKNSSGEAGTIIKYTFDPSISKISPLLDDKLAALEQNMDDLGC